MHSYAVYFLHVGTVKIAKIVHQETLGGVTELRDQWSKLVQFFQMTSNIINVSLKESVKKLAEQVEVARERSLAG